MSGERFDYTSERQRHENFVGRQALLGRLDELLVEDGVDRWVVVETVSDEYDKALEKLATKYRLPAPLTPVHDPAPDPDEILDHLSRWLRNHIPSGPPLRALLKRIERLRHDVRKLRPSKP